MQRDYRPLSIPNDPCLPSFIGAEGLAIGVAGSCAVVSFVGRADDVCYGVHVKFDVVRHKVYLYIYRVGSEIYSITTIGVGKEAQALFCQLLTSFQTRMNLQFYSNIESNGEGVRLPSSPSVPAP